MEGEALGASAAMLHVPQPMPLDAPNDTQHQNQIPAHAHTSARGRGGRNRGARGRGRRDSHKPSTDHPSGARPRLQRPKANMMARTLSEMLEEPKIALMHRVVNIAGPDIAWKTLLETLTIEEHGGLVVNADACGRPAHMMEKASAEQPRRRTKGGVFLTMLKTHVPKEVYKKIFEVEDDLKKKRKKQMRYVKHQKMEAKINQLPLQELFISGGVVAASSGSHEQREEGEDGEVLEHGGDVAMEDGEV